MPDEFTLLTLIDPQSSLLDKSDGPGMGWYDSGMVRGGQDFKGDFKVDITQDFKEYF